MKSFGSCMILQHPCFATNFLERTKDDSANSYVYFNMLLGWGQPDTRHQNQLLDIKTKN